MKRCKSTIIFGIIFGFLLCVINTHSATAACDAKEDLLEGYNEGLLPSNLVPRGLLKLTTVVKEVHGAEEIPVENSNIVIQEGPDWADDFIYITIKNIKLTLLGAGDTKGKGLYPAKTIKIYSATGLLLETEVVDGKITICIPNIAKATHHPYVMHLWGKGIGRDGQGWLVLYPDDPWVSYEKIYNKEAPNLNTLAIGLVMYPDKPTVPLKSLDMGKLKYGFLRTSLDWYQKMLEADERDRKKRLKYK